MGRGGEIIRWRGKDGNRDIGRKGYMGRDMGMSGRAEIQM